MNIIYCADRKYYNFLRISVLSLLEYNNNVTFHILTMDSPETNQYALSNVQISELRAECDETGKKYKIIIYDVRNLYERYLYNPQNIDKVFTPYAGLRLLIPFVCSFDKGLYLDCDFIIVRSIEEIYNQDISNDYLLAHLEEKQFNSGALLYNLKKEKENNFSKITEATTYYKEKILRFPDQEALNLAYGKVKSLRLKKIYFYDNDTYMFHISSKQVPEIIEFLNGAVFKKQGKNLHGKFRNIAQVISNIQNDASEENNLLNN